MVERLTALQDLKDDETSRNGTIDWQLSHHCRSDHSQFRSMAAQQVANQAKEPTSMGKLQTFPAEIRKMIYPYLISSGNLAILRACKAAAAEASPLVVKHGIYRRKIGFADDGRSIQEPVSIRVTDAMAKWPANRWILLGTRRSGLRIHDQTS